MDIIFSHYFGTGKSLLFALLLLLSGCHAYVLDDAQHDLRKSFTSGDYEQSEQLINKFEKEEIYKPKDAVLKNLEAGMIYHFSGNYDTSSVHFTHAEDAIDDAYTKSISRGFASLITNDNTLVYDGEPYEDVYLNAFKSLNYIHLHDWEAALVETRRMAYKMEQLDIRIKGLAEAFAKKDTTGKVEWSSGEVNLQNSAFSHYLSAILYAKSGKPDDARIEYEKLGTALEEQKRFRRYRQPEHEELEKIRYPESYNLLLTGFSGQAPRKVQKDFRLLLGDENTFYVKFSLPKLKLYDSEVHHIQAVINGGEQVVPLQLIEEMDAVSAHVYKAKEPIIYARSLLRATIKAGGTTFASSRVKKKNEGLGFLIDVLGIIGQEATEKADLRGWQTMPGQAWMNVVKLDKGTHAVRIEYLNRFDRTLYTETYDVVISDDAHLELIESIYSR